MSLLITPTDSISSFSPLLVTSTEEDRIPYSPYPYITSVNLDYTKPSVGVFENLNADPRIRKRIVKFFYYKILDNWLMDDLVDILNFFTIKDGKVDLIDNISQYEPLGSYNESEEIKEKKIDFIEDFFLTKSFVSRVLDEYVNNTKTNWYELPKNSYFIKDIIAKKLTNRIKRALSEKAKQ